MPTLPPTAPQTAPQRPTTVAEQPPADRPAAALVRLPTLTAPVEDEAALSASVTFAWTPVEGAKGYEVQVAEDERFADVVCRVRTTDATATAFDAFEPGYTYHWRVRHQDAHSRWATSTLPATFSTVPSAIPGRRMQGSSAPTPLTPVASAPVDSVSVPLAWTPVNGATAYHLQVSRSTDFSSIDLDLPLGPSSALTLVKLLPETGVRYVWRIRAQAAGAWTPWSTKGSFRASTDDEADVYETAFESARSASEQQRAREALTHSIGQAESESPHTMTGTSSKEAMSFILAILLASAVVIALVMWAYLR